MATHKLWKDNRIDQEYQVEGEAIAARFTEWMAAKGIDHVRYYNTERLIRFFLTSKEGMSSVFEEKDFQAMVTDLAPAIHDFEQMHTTNPSAQL